MQKLSKKKEYRERVLRNLATSLILHEKVKTTKALAKAVKPLVRKLIRYSLNNNLAARRNTAKILFTPKSIQKLFEDLPTRYLGQNINQNVQYYNLQSRHGDSAPMTLISLKLKPLETVIKEEDKRSGKKVTTIND